MKAIEPLREAGYLTTFSNGTLVESAVTVVGTGNTPLPGIQSLLPRYMFFDAPLTELKNATLNVTWSPDLAPLASTDYNAAVGWNGINNITAAQLGIIQQLVADAASVGLKSRFWDTPGTPIFARDNIWRVLLEQGAFWLNADDLPAAAGF